MSEFKQRQEPMERIKVPTPVVTSAETSFLPYVNGLACTLPYWINGHPEIWSLRLSIR